MDATSKLFLSKRFVLLLGAAICLSALSALRSPFGQFSYLAAPLLFWTAVVSTWMIANLQSPRQLLSGVTIVATSWMLMVFGTAVSQSIFSLAGFSINDYLQAGIWMIIMLATLAFSSVIARKNTIYRFLAYLFLLFAEMLSCRALMSDGSEESNHWFLAPLLGFWPGLMDLLTSAISIDIS